MIELHNQHPLAGLSQSRTLVRVGLIIVLPAAAPLTRHTTRMMPHNPILDREPSRDSARQ